MVLDKLVESEDFLGGHHLVHVVEHIDSVLDSVKTKLHLNGFISLHNEDHDFEGTPSSPEAPLSDCSSDDIIVILGEVIEHGEELGCFDLIG